ncbi:MAG TPA: hypothetical protein VFT22_22570 [Kofleriaceae bacterium]|nr:hypothetical protein [Kofleriaceae bacterium]
MMFGRHLERFLDRLAAGGGFALTRFGDGERAIMQGCEISTLGTNRHWCWRPSLGISAPEVSDDLRASFDLDTPHYHVGISCPCCNAGDYYYYLSLLPAHRRYGRTTYANLFSNGNYQRLAAGFIAALRAAGRPVVLMSNWDKDYARARAVLGGLEVIPAPQSAPAHDELIANPAGEGFYKGGAVLWYSRERAAAREAARELARRHPGAIFLVQLGPIANILIAEMAAVSPGGTYLDMGHALDDLLYGETSRGYMIAEAAPCQDIEVEWSP